MAEATYPKFFKVDGEIFKITEEKSVLVARRWDKKSRTFKEGYPSADVLWEGREISPNDLPAEIKEVM